MPVSRGFNFCWMSKKAEKRLKKSITGFLVWVVALSCWGEPTNEAPATAHNAFLTNTVISISVTNQPLLYVLHRMAEQSGVEITTKDMWLAGFPITKKIEGIPLEAALKELLGRLSYGIMYETAESGEITGIVINARSSGFSAEGSGVAESALLPDTQIVAQSSASITNPAEMEVIPPGKPGERGISLPELERLQKMRAGGPMEKGETPKGKGN